MRLVVCFFISTALWRINKLAITGVENSLPFIIIIIYLLENDIQ